MSKIHILLEWLIAICIISVGYSGWAITIPEDAEASGSFNAYPVIRAEEYIEYGSIVFSRGQSVSIGNNGATADDTNLVLNRGIILIPVTLKANCFSSAVFADDCMTIDLTIQLVSNGSVNTVFLGWFNTSQSCDIGEDSGIVNGNPSTAAPSYNAQTGELTLSQKLSWDESVTDAQTFYIAVDLEIKANSALSVEQIFNSMGTPQISIKTYVKNS